MTRCRQLSRFAFTLIELLVVIAIIAVLMGLLLPAIQRVREAANKAHCASNLRQLGVAANNYLSQHGKFPPGYVGVANGPPGTWEQDHISTWQVEILPYIEQDNIAKQVITKAWKPGQVWSYQKYLWYNRNIFSQEIPMLLCPSDGVPRPALADQTLYVDPVDGSSGMGYGPPDGEPDDPEYGIKAKRGVSSYKGNSGTSHFFPATYDGAFRGWMLEAPITHGLRTKDFEEGLPLEGFRDGISNTILLGERYGRDLEWEKLYGPFHLFNMWCWPYVNMQFASGWAPINYKFKPDEYSPIGGTPLFVAVSQSDPSDIRFDVDSNADRAKSRRSEYLRLNAFGSGHMGGANFVFADGSLRFLNDETPVEVLRMLCTRAGNELLPEGY